jgi:hypothetical protein
MEDQNALAAWISTDELTDAIFSLRILSGLLEKAESDPLYWKWIIIILHNALQTLMVAVLHDRYKVGSSRGDNKKKTLEKWRDLHDPTKCEKILSNDEKLKDVYMADFMDLFTNLKSQRVDGVTLDKPFEPTDVLEKGISDLNFWRNYFMHFLPGIRTLSAWEYLTLMPRCIEFAEFLTQAPGILDFRDLDKEAKESVSILKKQIESLRRKYIEKFPQLRTI